MSDHQSLLVPEFCADAGTTRATESQIFFCPFHLFSLYLFLLGISESCVRCSRDNGVHHDIPAASSVKPASSCAGCRSVDHAGHVPDVLDIEI
jgi:hypothetical protein